MNEGNIHLTCLNCEHEFDGDVSLDALGWHSACPECKSTFDVDVPDRRFVIAFAKDGPPDDPCRYQTDSFTGEGVASIHAFGTAEEFIECWKKLSEQPEGMWYWCLDAYPGQSYTNEPVFCICSGACDPSDIEIFAAYPPLSEAAAQLQEPAAEPEKSMDMKMGGIT